MTSAQVPPISMSLPHPPTTGCVYGDNPAQGTAGHGTHTAGSMVGALLALQLAPGYNGSVLSGAAGEAAAYGPTVLDAGSGAAPRAKLSVVDISLPLVRGDPEVGSWGDRERGQLDAGVSVHRLKHCRAGIQLMRGFVGSGDRLTHSMPEPPRHTSCSCPLLMYAHFLMLLPNAHFSMPTSRCPLPALLLGWAPDAGAGG